MQNADAGQLLQSTQRLRVHWVAQINAILGYTWAIVIGIWSFLLKAFMDASARSERDSIIFILAAAAGSSFILGLWRFSTRHLDLRVAGLFPTFVYCETTMAVPPAYGTVEYLREHALKQFPLPADPEKLLQGIGHLVRIKRLGTRGQGPIDVFAGFLIALQFLLVVHVSDWSPASYASLFAILFSFALVVLGHYTCQREPALKHLQEAFPDSVSTVSKRASEVDPTS